MDYIVSIYGFSMYSQNKKTVFFRDILKCRVFVKSLEPENVLNTCSGTHPRAVPNKLFVAKSHMNINSLKLKHSKYF